MSPGGSAWPCPRGCVGCGVMLQGRWARTKGSGVTLWGERLLAGTPASQHRGECQTHRVHLLPPRRGFLLGSGQPRSPERKGSRRDRAASAPQPLTLPAPLCFACLTRPSSPARCQHPLSHPWPLGSEVSPAPHPSPKASWSCPIPHPARSPQRSTQYLAPCSSPRGGQALATGTGSPGAVRPQAAACMVAEDAVPSDTADPRWGHIYSSASVVTHKFFGQGSEGLGLWGRRCEICPSCVNRGPGGGWGRRGCDLWWKSKTQKGKFGHHL